MPTLKQQEVYFPLLLTGVFESEFTLNIGASFLFSGAFISFQAFKISNCLFMSRWNFLITLISDFLYYKGYLLVNFPNIIPTCDRYGVFLKHHFFNCNIPNKEQRYITLSFIKSNKAASWYRKLIYTNITQCGICSLECKLV